MEKRPLSFSLFSPNKLGNKGFIICLACVASVSVRFRSKERGARVKDRAKMSLSCSETERKRLLRRLLYIACENIPAKSEEKRMFSQASYYMSEKKTFFLRDQSRKSQADSCSIANQNVIFTLSCPLTDSAMHTDKVV